MTKYKYFILHIPTNTLSIESVECFTELSFLDAVTDWNANAFTNQNVAPEWLYGPVGIEIPIGPFARSQSIQ